MVIKYEAVFGAGYYFNLRRQHNMICIVDVLHRVEAGWTIDEDIKTTILQEYFIPVSEITIDRLATPEEIWACAIGELIERYPEALVQDSLT